MTAPQAPSVPGPVLDAATELQHDAANRQRALDCGQSFIIEAPAGAGKTELLTQRFLALLATVKQPEEIVALTFTNKAAAEMRERIVRSLDAAHRGEPPSEPHKQATYQLSLAALAHDATHHWGLLQTPSRLQVTTLDALCGRLARQMPLLSRLGSQPGIALDPAAHYHAAAQDTLQLLHGTLPIADTLARVLDHFDNDAHRLQPLLQSMLASRDQWLNHLGHVLLPDAESALGELVEDALDQLLRVFDAPTQHALMPMARFAASQLELDALSGSPLSPAAQCVVRLLDWQTPLHAQLVDLPAWQGLATLLLTGGGDIRSTAPSDLGISSPEAKNAFKAVKPLLKDLKDAGHSALLERALALPQPTYEAAETQLLQDLIDVLKVASAQLWVHFQAAREVDFIDMAQRALLALGDELAPTDLQLQLDYTISHLLVDEFQDTSPTQIRLIERLTTGWEARSHKTVFLVGDPMQSIYRFRKADVGLFIRVRDHGLGQLHPTPLQLYRNNRSDPAVVQWVNQSFTSIFPSHDHSHLGAVRFKPAHATRSANVGAGVQIHPQWAGVASDDQEPLDDTDSDSNDNNTPLDSDSCREARLIIALIRQAQARQPQGTIGVLVRARSHLQALVSELAQHPDLSYQAVDIEALAERQVIADLMSLTRALLHRADRVHWLAVLRAPWCGLTWADLYTLVADDTRSTVWSLMQQDGRVGQLTPDGQQRLQHVRSVLQEAYAHQIQQRPRRWVEGVWQSLGGPLCLTHSADLLDSTAYFDALDRITQFGQLQLERLDDEVAHVFAAPDPQANGLLQLMTLHKSKGLEFDTVIVPSLHRGTGQDDAPLLLWDPVLCHDGRERLVVASAAPRDMVGTASALKYPFLQSFEHTRAQHEAQRLLYVAVTRARHHLHLLGQVKLHANGLPRLPPKTSLLRLLWPVVQSQFDPATNPATPSAAPPPTTATPPAAGHPQGLEHYAHQLVRLSNPHWPAVLHTTAAAASLASSHGAPETPAAAHVLAADTGTLIHLYLFYMAQDGLAAWPADRLHAAVPAMQQWLQRQGHSSDAAVGAAANAHAQLCTTVACTQGQWVLSPHAQARSEWAQACAGAQGTTTHVVDRTFVYQGQRWIIDYKTTTDTHADPRQWRDQLQRYATLFDDTLPIQCAIFFTHTGTLHLI